MGKSLRRRRGTCARAQARGRGRGEFATIAHAVQEAALSYDNIRKSILYILPTNGGETMAIVIVILLGITLPITPVQILWVNMVTEVSP
jgi:magnesium-transporting ATPase (P-type)